MADADVLGNYESYLEIVFGINLLFSAWKGIYLELSNLGTAARKNDERSLRTAHVDGSLAESVWKLHDWQKRLRKGFVAAGRVVGLSMASIIGIVLFYFPSTHPVNPFLWWVILSSGALVPAMMVLMVVVDGRFAKTIRVKGNEVIRERVDAQAAKAAEIAEDIEEGERPIDPNDS